MSLEQSILDSALPFAEYHRQVYRIVETQQQAATMNLVDNLEEQDLLEQLLDEVKPPYAGHAKDRHYLIKSPFRYPPLKYGSRFGTIQQGSYFYASESINTLLAECAYYRFVFFNDIKNSYPHSVNSQHMSFSVEVESSKMADLSRIIDETAQALLQHPRSYALPQSIGKMLVEKGCEVIRYFSARTTAIRNSLNGKNVALSTSTCILSPTPEQQVHWQCQSNTDKIILRNEYGEMSYFHLANFLIDGVLPRPA